MTLGEKIVSLRRQAGLSQERLAGELGVSRQAVSRWETNSALPDAMNVLALSRLFGVSADYLLNDGFPAAGASAAAHDSRALRAAALAALLAGALWNLGLYIAGHFVNAGRQLISELENGVTVTSFRGKGRPGSRGRRKPAAPGRVRAKVPAAEGGAQTGMGWYFSSISSPRT